MRQDGPSVRAIFNKDGVITDKDIKGLQSVYKEAIKPKKNSSRMEDSPYPVKYKG